MKKTIIGCFFLAVILVTSAFVTEPFPGWDKLTEASTDIIIVRSLTNPPPGKSTQDIMFERTLFQWQVEVIKVLKGKTNNNAGLLVSNHLLRDGEYYLAFAKCQDGYYGAFPEYDIVPVGKYFTTNFMAGKTVVDNVHFLLKQRINRLKLEIANDEAEKKRLEEAFK